VGTVPAIRTAAASGGGRVAIWATVATTGSAYQRRLIETFAAGSTVTAVACPGLADAVDAGDPGATAAAITAAAGRTPTGSTDVVLGCTEYELVPDLIASALADAGIRGVTLHGSAGAIATQTLRRIRRRAGGVGVGTGRLEVLLSGRPAGLPPAARRYPAGLELTSGSGPVAAVG
jgi:glutamate racemase